MASQIPTPVDIYVPAPSQWHYLAAVIDLYARRAVVWNLPKPDVDLAIRALDMVQRVAGATACQSP